MLSNDAKQTNKQTNKQELFRELYGHWKTGVGKWYFDGESGTTPLLKGAVHITAWIMLMRNRNPYPCISQTVICFNLAAIMMQ